VFRGAFIEALLYSYHILSGFIVFLLVPLALFVLLFSSWSEIQLLRCLNQNSFLILLYVVSSVPYKCSNTLTMEINIRFPVAFNPQHS